MNSQITIDDLKKIEAGIREKYMVLLQFSCREPMH